jgi:phage shock protein E
MIKFINQLFGREQPDYSELFKQGAQIVDVRTSAEFSQGHIRGAVNIPLQHLNASMGKIKKDKPIITCCASGLRSARAKGMLKAAGFQTVHNGGSWMSLQKKI